MLDAFPGGDEGSIFIMHAWLLSEERNGEIFLRAGFGFVSFTDTIEGVKALREMDGKYIGNRPCKLRKSTWDERTNTQQLNKKRKGHHDGKPVLNMKKHVGVLHR
jgi:hypothetical protein